MEKETNERLDNLESRIEELKQEILKLQNYLFKNEWSYHRLWKILTKS